MCCFLNILPFHEEGSIGMLIALIGQIIRDFLEQIGSNGNASMCGSYGLAAMRASMKFVQNVQGTAVEFPVKPCKICADVCREYAEAGNRLSGAIMPTTVHACIYLKYLIWIKNQYRFHCQQRVNSNVPTLRIFS